MTFRRKIGFILVFIALSVSPGCRHDRSEGDKKESMEYQHTNELINESSPYLLQHAHNPVNWMPWNEKTLALAQKEQKPILVSIGYAACHWCHVMEHESFENEEVAKLMNNKFICIKVDREERPDVDQYYMSAVNLITGSGGWPLNCFALPNGKPFHGGTYYRKDDWIKVLSIVANEFANNRPKLEEFASRLENGIAETQLVMEKDSSDTDLEKELHYTVMQWMPSFDKKEGGGNKAPKFPMPDNYRFLLRYANHYGQQDVLRQVYLTLDKMQAGGIYDQIGGGFARYSVDELWKVPHFEKMLYDNAQLISLYADAYKQSRHEAYKKTALETADFCMNELMAPEGIFYSSLDADSEGEEGLFYTWTDKELVEALNDQMDFARLYFKLDSRGKWEGRNILMRNLSREDITEELNLTDQEYDEAKESMISTIRKIRAGRVRPGLDDKSLTSWNSMMISALVDAYLISGDEKYLKQAKSTAVFIGEKLLSDKHLLHVYKAGKVSVSGFLEDYAFYIRALIDLNAVAPVEGDLNLADQLAEYVGEHFYNQEKGVFQFTEIKSKEFGVAPIEIMDNVIPSSNAVMASVLRDLYMITANNRYYQIYSTMIRRVAPVMKTYGSGYSHWAQVIMDEVGPSYEVVIMGENAVNRSVELGRRYIPNALLLTSVSANKLSVFEGRYKQGETLIYVCQDRACKIPVTETEQVKIEP